MSRIIVTRYDSGEDHIVVGWDHPCGGAFWQEFNSEPTVEQQEDGRWKVASSTHKVRFYDTQDEAEEHQYDDWEEMKRYDGYMPGIPFDKFPDSVPDDLKPLIVTMEIGKLIEAHWKDPDSGRTVVDLSDQHERTTANA